MILNASGHPAPVGKRPADIQHIHAPTAEYAQTGVSDHGVTAVYDFDEEIHRGCSDAGIGLHELAGGGFAAIAIRHLPRLLQAQHGMVVSRLHWALRVSVFFV
jgi:hypothetical protein